MELSTLDRISRGKSPLHQAAPQAKLLGVALAIGGLTLSRSPWDLLLMGIGWMALLEWARLPALRILGWAAYAGVFVLFYLIATWEGFPEASTMLLKAVGSALAMLTLITTTPYPRLFGALQPLMPAPLPDALLLIFRSFFILLHRWTHLDAALRLRGEVSWKSPRQSLVGLSPALGTLLLGAMDHSEALYEAMLLRGYRGVLGGPVNASFSPAAILPILVGGMGLASVFLPLTPLMVVVFGVLLLVGIGSRRWTS